MVDGRVAAQVRGALTNERRDRQLGVRGVERTMPERGLTMETQPGIQPQVARKKDHAGGLLLVGLFKLSKAVFFTAVGAGALHLVHKDVGNVVMHIIDALRIDPESRFVGMVMDKAYLINSHQLRRAGTLSFLYAGLCVVEGTGLVLRKGWAEYFTVILTAMALPWETYELVERYSPYKVGLLIINLVVLFYLLWILKRKKEQEQAEAC
jgi:uncharacterized membrane protein (DUF2068 family)